MTEQAPAPEQAPEQEPTQAPEPSQEPTPVTGVNVFKNIVSLLKAALHPGAHAQYVTEAIAFLEQIIAKETELAPVASPAPLTVVK